MTNRSAKAKGKRAVEELRIKLLESSPTLQPTDIVKPVGTVPGADLILSPHALTYYPFTFEVKNQQKLNIWDSIKQSESHALNTNLTPVLVFKRNNTELYVTMKLEDWLKLVK
jgi:hypothetical protein